MKNVRIKQLKYFSHIRKYNTITETVLKGKVEGKKERESG